MIVHHEHPIYTAANYSLDSGTNQERSHSPPLLAPKVLLDEAQLKLLKRKRQDKGKGKRRADDGYVDFEGSGRPLQRLRLSDCSQQSE